MTTTDATRSYRAEWAARKRRLVAYGRWETQQKLVDPAPVREHIANLRATGMGLRSIAHLAGEHYGHLGRLIYPNHADYLKAISADRAAKYLAVRLDIDKMPPKAMVDATGTRRRIEALICNGWSQGAIAERLETTHQHVSRLRSIPRVTAASARRVRDLYDELWNTHGPSNRARLKAQREGWAPPLAWDDDTIDDPTAEPADMSETRAGTAERIEDVEWLLQNDPHATLLQVAERLGVERGTLLTALIRAGRDDLRDQLADNAELAGFTVRRRTA